MTGYFGTYSGPELDLFSSRDSGDSSSRTRFSTFGREAFCSILGCREWSLLPADGVSLR